LKILVVSPHPDDLEISCAGTLKRFQDAGAEIISVVTVRPSAEDNANRSKWIVEHELEKSYGLSGFELRVLETDLHPNGRPDLKVNNITMTALSELLEPCDLAIIPHPEDFHQDHANTYHLAWPLVRKLAREVWCMHTVPYCQQHSTNSANMFYNIREQWSFKKSLLMCYNSYFSHDDIMRIYTANQYWGQQNGAELAEAFTIKKRYVE
jgi:LmbE family N-acetylglucosaminyl deacetylase